jgi:RimJ/RimL family protein N-acetyltransferase
MFKLTTERLIIRDMSLQDEQAFVDITQNEKYQRFYSEEDSSPEKARQLTRLFVEQIKETPRKNYQLAIELKTTGQFIGTICLRIEANNEASMGCGLAREFHGQGLIQEAGSAMSNFAFSRLKVERVYAETMAENRAAIRLCQQLGMTLESINTKQHYFKNRWWDGAVLSMTSKEYLAKSSNS